MNAKLLAEQRERYEQVISLKETQLTLKDIQIDALTKKCNELIHELALTKGRLALSQERLKKAQNTN